MAECENEELSEIIEEFIRDDEEHTEEKDFKLSKDNEKFHKRFRKCKSARFTLGGQSYVIGKTGCSFILKKVYFG